MKQENIFLVLECLNRFTDRDHAVSIRDISDYLEREYNLTLTPITIRRYIDCLTQNGHAIEEERHAHNTAYYKLTEKQFTFNEIRFIVDSISINRFLSYSEKQNLIHKFEGFCSDAEVRQLVSRVSIGNESPRTGQLLENLEKVHSIISENRRINFQYARVGDNGEVEFYDKPRNILPRKVVYFSDRFYLKCLDLGTGQVRTYRIDRMRDIRGGEVYEEKVLLPEPEGAVVDMFEPDSFADVRLRVRRSLRDEMVEMFGTKATIIPLEDGWDEMHIRMGISKGFFRWVLKYGASMELLYPPELRERMRDELRATLAVYEK